MPTVNQDAKDVLQEALNLFGPDGRNWVKGNGRAPIPYDALTALYFAAMNEFTPRYMWRGHDCPEIIGISPLLDVIGLSKTSELVTWNDAPERTWEEVKQAFEKAIQFS